MLRFAEKVRTHLVRLPRRQKRLIQVAVDVLLVWLALWLAFYVRLGNAEFAEPFDGHAWLFAIAPVVSIPFFVRLGMYRAVMRYFGNDALMTIVKAVSLSALSLSLAIYWYTDAPKLIPRSMVFNYWWVSLVLIGGLRLVMRHYFMGNWFTPASLSKFKTRDAGLAKVAIYGAGAAGNQLVAALRLGRVMRPVAFIDDDPNLYNRSIAGLHVYSAKHIGQMVEDTGAIEILLAIPSATRARRREILEMLEYHPLHVRSVPGFMDLASGKVQVDDIQEVDIADLLGRDAVPPAQLLLEKCIRSQVVMVTGAGGSIGSELCRQIIASQPAVLLLFEHSEYNLYSIHLELERRIGREALSTRLVPILGSIRNTDRLLDVMRTWGVQTVYHAAAYKHVPMVEHNVAEGVMNNVVGTVNTVQAAMQAGVSNFVLISTDKAVRPTNIMGSTKRVAEMVLQALSREPAPVLFGSKDGVHHVNKTRFSMVRFGNVLGSSGSVIPRFYQQIRAGGPVTVTDARVKRYFMTIFEAVQLVLQAGAEARGGEVFVLDMGEPVPILQLARQVIESAGYSLRDAENPEGEIEIQIIGLRPGEKLEEELTLTDELITTGHPKIFCARETTLSEIEVATFMRGLRTAVAAGDEAAAHQLLHRWVEGYGRQDTDRKSS